MELASLLVLVIDVTVQVGLGAEPHGAVGVGALVWSLVVTLVVATGVLVICVGRQGKEG